VMTDRALARTAGAGLAALLGVAAVLVQPAAGVQAATCPSAGGVTVPNASAPAGSDYAVYGHGWGHSLGMSQYGAEGAATLGCLASQILSTYYTGTHVATSSTLGSTVMLTLLSPTPKGHTDVIANSGVITWLAVAAKVSVTQATGLTWHVVPDVARGGEDLVDDKGAVRLWVAVNGELRAYEGSGSPNPNVARVRTFGGSAGTTLVTDLQLKWDYTQFITPSTGMQVRQVIVPTGSVSGVQKYLWGIAEVPVTWPAESLKAQAIAARTYLAHGSWSPTANAYVIGTTTASQNYTGYAKEAEDAQYGLHWQSAVNATAQQVVETSTGALADTLYMSSAGGRTEDVRYVWGSTGYPYLVSVDDSRWEMASSDPADHRSWALGFSRAQLAAALGVSTVTSVTVGAPGSAARLTGVHVTGTVSGAPVVETFLGSQMRSMLGALSPGMTFARLDSVPPVATVSAGPAAAFRWSATDASPSSGLAGYQVTVQHGTAVDWTTPSTTGTSVTLPGVPGTTYQVTVVASDRAGNASAPVTASSVVPPSGTYHALTPVRVADTRSHVGIPGPAGGHSTVGLKLAGVYGVPANASAVAVNVTATGATAPGYVAPGSTALTSGLSYTPGVTTAGLMVLPVGPSGTVTLTNGGAKPVHLILDLQGYVTPDTTGAGFAAATPVRVADSRSGLGLAGPVRPGATVQVPMPAALAGAQEAVLNVTATGASAVGSLSAGPATTSNLNYAPGRTVANLVVAPVTGGLVTLHNGTTGSVQLVVDVLGSFTTAPSGRAYDPVAGTRLADSRLGHGLPSALGGGATATIPVAALGGSPVPAGVSAVVADVTVTGATTGGYLSPGGSTSTSLLNFSTAQTVSNLVVLPVVGGAVSVTNGGAGAVQLTLDVQGYLEP
jgi:stage II sporulation protein D